MGDPRDDRWLVRSLVDDGVDALSDVYGAYGPCLVAYAQSLLGGAGRADGVVADALCVAVGRARFLREPVLLRSWLYALVRNECLRRRGSTTDAGGWPVPGSDAEATLLGIEHGLASGEVASILGSPQDEFRFRFVLARAAATPPPAPTAVVPLPGEGRPRGGRGGGDAPGPSGAVQTLARRAAPFDRAGFPVPLDSRRIPLRAVAATTLLVVLVALVLLVMLPW